MESFEVMSNGVESCDGGSVECSDDVKENENRDVELLEDLDSYMQDINDRLTISRMVSNSVIKGMVNAVTLEAEEKIADKELEVSKLKDMLHVYHVGADENEVLPMHRETKGTNGGMYSSFNEAVVEHARVEKSLGILRGATKEQFEKVKKEIDSIRGCSSIKRINSGSQLGFGDILQDNVSDRWLDVDRSLNSLKSTIETAYQQVEEMVSLSKASVCEWQLEQEFKAEIEALVMKNCIWSVKDQICDQFYGDKNLNWNGRLKEISSLREELVTISKSLFVSDIGLLSSHGSLEGEEESNNHKMGDRSHSKVLNNSKLSPQPSLSTTLTTSKSLSSSTSTSSSIWEENGKHDVSEINMQESLDATRLSHMTPKDLINYYHHEMTKLKRSHESIVQDKTEELFRVRRELLKERGSSLPSKKSKEFDVLRKEISKVVSKLDEILVEKEEVATVGDNDESLSSLNDRLDSLLHENQQLREFLTDKKREVKCLSFQLSEAAEKMSEHSLAEAKLLRTTANLKSAVEDGHIKASIAEDTVACILKEVMDQFKRFAEMSQVESSLMQEIYKSKLKENAHNAQPANNCEIEDFNMECTIMQEVCVLIFEEALKDAEQKFNDLNMKYIEEKELRVFRELEKLEKEIQFKVVVANIERLKQEILVLVEEKEQLAQDAVDALEKEKERSELAAQELQNLREVTYQQQKVISESIEETNTTKHKLVEALEHIERLKVDISKLDQKLELAMKELSEVNEEKKRLLDVNQEKQNTLSLFEVKEKELKEQLESTAVYIRGLLHAFTDFECRVTQDISKKFLRLNNLKSQSHILKQKANVIVRRKLLYQQRYEKKCSDLEKAEAEVDLLGDEVDTLLGLVEKIYIALDHYSPILQHYPGITEILKLVRRELSGEIKGA